MLVQGKGMLEAGVEKLIAGPLIGQSPKRIRGMPVVFPASGEIEIWGTAGEYGVKASGGMITWTGSLGAGREQGIVIE